MPGLSPEVNKCAAFMLTIPGVETQRSLVSFRLNLLGNTGDGVVDPENLQLARQGIIFKHIKDSCGQCGGTCTRTHHPDGTADGFVTPKCPFLNSLQQLGKVDDDGNVL